MPTKGQNLTLSFVPADADLLVCYQEQSNDSEPIPEYNNSYVRRIRDLCMRNNAQLVLISMPSPAWWTYEMHNSTERLARELSVPYIDMNLIKEEVPIDWDKDTPDGGDHLNYFGSQKVAVWLGAYLQDTGLFEDKRVCPEYSYWNQDYDFYVNHLDELRIEKRHKWRFSEYTQRNDQWRLPGVGSMWLD